MSLEFCTIQPVFRVVDWEAVLGYLPKFVEATRGEAGCLYYGFTVDTEKKFCACREAYVDGAAMVAHLDNVGGLIGEMLSSGAAVLETVEAHGPALELAVAKEKLDPLGTTYFEFQCGYAKIETSVASDQTFCNIYPTFKVNDLAAVEKFTTEAVEKTKTEEGLLYYGFTLDKKNNLLFCREAYKDADAVLAHLANVGEALNKGLQDKIFDLLSISIHGPSEQLDKLKEPTKAFGTTFFDIVPGCAFSKYKALPLKN